MTRVLIISAYVGFFLASVYMSIEVGGDVIMKHKMEVEDKCK